MNQLPLVTIICICYNHETFVTESLNSVVNQSYKNIQIIIVDDASNDNSVKEIKNWMQNHSDVIFIENEKNLGNTISFNKALKHAKGSFIIDLATDDVLLYETINKQINAFNKEDNVALVFGNAELIDEKGHFLSYYFEVDKNTKTIDSNIHKTNYISILKGGKCMCSVSGMIKAEELKKLGGFDENLIYEDLDIWLRIARNYDIKYVDEPLIKKRIVPFSQSSFFFQNTEYARKINASTYIILNKAFKMNRTVNEHKALLKRVHHEIKHNFKFKNNEIVLKNGLLKIKIHLKILLLKLF